ncbi:oxysterol-binding protein-related protein 1-like [Mya arenaria]|uniref:oxysterol-binding protein-related protein 1-like n=1 Tax=Mya arenaria TaxID=6604 RepID=UPI0022E7925D|nr:oxysterol-binding protein-related protein 1-like [Mya arenaria]XP_052761404.1 oxysterol-binding protein-related protein 1-like [Mya arenaria]XP_052761405.1 oxysterol-binding protein-related protein 1-like [Mya arenaria]XP_052761406.1 oxysterol-binding protein-related protein 1-like [Mya arenaria]XP_052761407.1 oxysterol-binding protein-related protein 1-like [Mya arenaria]XP_052761408.1 oxysterol-binding protein-related protein 1-like [Mya arenaria]XP_052764806.1 oxysterol-binding protein-
MSSGASESEEEISIEESLLLCARRGQTNIIHDILQSKKQGTVQLNINCKGSQKANRGWTPLHLAAYFGHTDSVKLLLQFGARVNEVNNVGDTALHKAVLTNRLEVVRTLLAGAADVSLINAEGQKAGNLTTNKEIIRLIDAAEEHDASKMEEEFMSSVREGHLDKIQELVSSGRFSRMDCRDSFGNTALHVAAQSGQKEVAVYLLQQGVHTNTKNKQGQLASEVARTEPMKQLLHVQPRKTAVKMPARFEGLLIKKRFMGTTPVWVVLERGVLSYFKNRGDASTGAKRRGMKYLDNATLKTSETIIYDFLIQYSDGTYHRLGIDPGASNVRVGHDPVTGEVITRQVWINALKEHIAYNTHYIDQGRQKHVETTEIEPCITMQEALKVALAHKDVLEHHVGQLSNFVTSANNLTQNNNVDKLTAELEKTITYSRDMYNTLSKCLIIYMQEEQYREKEQHELKEKNRILEESLHALAIEHHELERSYSHSVRARSFSLDDEEFFDCDDDDNIDIHLPLSLPMDRRSMVSDMSYQSCQFDLNTADSENKPVNYQLQLGGRTDLPVPMFDRNDFSIWSILKQCIGKELSKITMPVVFNEPLTFLQRITEYLEYSTLLDMAAKQDNPVDRLMYVSAFAVSAISSNWDRIGKPFNPLLGETYELDRPDLGFRLVSEQVCHHPPISAFHIEAENYKFQGSILPKLKFWGKSVEVNPKGTLTLEFPKHGETYTWQNVNCCVHNVIVGKIWIEHTGVMEIVNHKTKHKAVLNFKQGGWFGKDLHKVEGFIYDPSKRKMKALYGSWIYDLFGVDNDAFEDYMKNKPSSPKHTSSENGDSSEVEDNIPTHHLSAFNLNIPGQVALWSYTPRPSNTDQYFSFTYFSMALNELVDGMQDTLPPTDSRLRPDVRILEQGNIEVAGEEKHRVEEKQRSARKDRKKRNVEWSPLWFQFGKNQVTEKEDWIYNGKYWDREWSQCPDIF